MLPGLIFIFLKRFGKNEFAIPVYYQHVDSLNSICGTTYRAPYTLPDSVLRKSGWKYTSATLFIFNDADQNNDEFNRIAESFTNTEYETVEITDQRLGEATYTRWTSCVFFIVPPWNVILVDDQKRIRGYYSARSRDEIDRLILEMTILLQKY